MKRKITVIITLILITIFSTNAKTIWFRDDSRNDNSMVNFYNLVIEDLKLSQYWKYFSFFKENEDINQMSGDIIIILSGSTAQMKNTGYNITHAQWTGCRVDECNHWQYLTGGTYMFSDDYILQHARYARNEIIELLNRFFK